MLHSPSFGYCTKNHELHYQIRFGTWDIQTTKKTPYRCIKVKSRSCSHFTLKSITKKSSLQIKKFLLWRKLSISKTIEFMHGHPKKPVNWCRGMTDEECPMTVSLFYIFVKRTLKAMRHYQRDILTNTVEPLNQTLFQNTLCTIIRSH